MYSWQRFSPSLWFASSTWWSFLLLWRSSKSHLNFNSTF
jgi:hypothetical protein